MLHVTELEKTFYPGTPAEKHALGPVTLTLQSGEFVTLIGGNGAGKSTLFNAIAGEFLPDAGFIELDGQDITFLPEHRRAALIGRLFQDPMKGTAPSMTIEENLTLAYLSAGRGGTLRGKAQRRAFFAAQLGRLGLGLETRLKTPVGLLSGGQRQALTLLMATIVPPRLLLLDEHTAALDPATAEKVLALTNEIVHEHQLTCMMVTHNIDTALRTGTRTLMLEDGRLVLDLAGEARAGMTVETLLAKFRSSLNNDRILLPGSGAV